MRLDAIPPLSLVLSLLTLLSAASPVSGECQPPASILSPTSLGQSGQTRAANFLALIDSLYQSPATQALTKAGVVFQVPPWFDRSTECGAERLRGGFGLIGVPTFSNYLLASDELSELAIVTALANRDDRMLAIHHTIEALASNKYPGIPCWIAQVTNGQISCLSQDTASDATARFGLAYYFAANNLSFPSQSRALYRAVGDALAARHLAVEYAKGCFRSSISGKTLCEWIAGGGDSAGAGVGRLEMWVGYFQDVSRFLIAAFQSTGNAAYLQRAEDVVDQWLIAISFAGGPLSVGHFNFGWDTGSGSPKPIPGYRQYWDHDPAWDESDSPRVLWIGDVLRAIKLSRGAVPETVPYALLLDWVGKVQIADGQPPNYSCIQLNHDGTPYVNAKGESNCGHDYYYTGLGAGLHTYVNTAELQPKLDEALSQFGWDTTRTWNFESCFGIYRGIRPVKALAAAIGLDSAAYACSAKPAACGTDPAELCLGSGRFKVTATWRIPQGASNGALPIALSADTGYFWFFSSSNVEVVIKVLDGCGFNGHYWVFATGLTDVGVELKVTDTQAGLTRTYTNSQGVRFAPIQDISAFATCP